MTTFTWRAAFYPAVAFPVLAATVLFAYSANRLLFPASKRGKRMFSTAVPDKLATTQSSQDLSTTGVVSTGITASPMDSRKSRKPYLSNLWPSSLFQKGPAAEDSLAMMPPITATAVGPYTYTMESERYPQQPLSNFSVQANVPNAW
jgi:hypothetical protein